MSSQKSFYQKIVGFGSLVIGGITAIAYLYSNKDPFKNVKSKEFLKVPINDIIYTNDDEKIWSTKSDPTNAFKKAFDPTYNEDLKENEKCGVIINIGGRRQGKSFNASIISVLLCEIAVYFPSNIPSTTGHHTKGINISPPLKPTVNVQKKLGDILDKIIIMDFEGFEMHNYKHHNEQRLMHMIHLWKNVNPIFVHSMANEISPNDMRLFKDLCIELAKNVDETIPYIICVSEQDNAAESDLWKEMKKWIKNNHRNINVKLFGLPLFGNDSRSKNIKNNVSYKTIKKNPMMQNMKKDEIIKYCKLCDHILGCLKEYNKVTDLCTFSKYFEQTLKYIKQQKNKYDMKGQLQFQEHLYSDIKSNNQRKNQSNDDDSKYNSNDDDNNNNHNSKATY